MTIVDFHLKKPFDFDSLLLYLGHISCSQRNEHSSIDVILGENFLVLGQTDILQPTKCLKQVSIFQIFLIFGKMEKIVSILEMVGV